MLEERIKNLIEKRDLKQKELENLRGQRTHRNPYSGLDEVHEVSDVNLDREIKLLEKSIKSYEEAIEATIQLTKLVDEGKINYGTTFNFSLENGFNKTVTLVDKLTSADKGDYITDKSPIGKAVKGKASGDVFSYLTPDGLEMNGIINEVYQKQAKQR